MRDHLLFIDTEASGLPKNWNISYSSDKNWPHIAQLSWIIYTKQGLEVKREDHFISDDDFEITNSAKKIHGITREFLNKNGEPRKKVLTLLENDLDHFRPLIIGHFMDFDFHIISADAYRAGIENPLSKFPSFCTMLATIHLSHNPAKSYLKLFELHAHLFDRTPVKYHAAIADAETTAHCFFELLRRGEINEDEVKKQQKFLREPEGKPNTVGCSFAVMFTILFTLLILFYD